MALLKKSLIAATVLESLVAMIILFVSFTLCTMVFVNVISAMSIPEKVSADIHIAAYFNETLKSNAYFDGVKIYNDKKMTRTIYPYQKFEDLMVMEISVESNSGRIIAKNKKIFIKHEP